ncbi:tyrosine-type recombinase/integrase [Halopseudomonas oceani]|uniref:tyrosine-type recombinase/integrase n=1 Tax=Halopseudomonas oceani TaxID=1708783 RepID=UPI002AA69785|nr:tyrosine-type recombinase/integrase [Halopseudomonas oceani]
MDITPAKPQLREQLRNAIRVNHYSIRTKKTSRGQIRYFLRYHQMRPPSGVAARWVVRTATIDKPAGCHTFRQAFAAELMYCGSDVRTAQPLFGHANVRATQIYTHFLGNTFAGVQSPLS